MVFKELLDEFPAPMRAWSASSGGFTWTILYDGIEYAANCREDEHKDDDLVLIGGPWGSFEEAETACHELLLPIKLH